MSNQLLAVTILVVFGLTGCQPTTVNFDKFPDGSSVPAQTSAVLHGNSVNPQSIIFNQYASAGVTFTPPVFAMTSPNVNVPSPPNAACPTAGNGRASFSTPTEIKISQSNICNVWVTVTGTSAPTTMTAFDVSGRQIGTTTGQGRLHINACDIDKVVLSAVNYCFDDFQFRR